MPLLLIHSQVTPKESATHAHVLGTLTSLLARELNKPERYVMVALAPLTAISFANTQEPAIYAEMKNVGHLSTSQIENLAQVLNQALSKAFSVQGDRIYIEFTNADGALWGWNGGTFG
jgi:phenylpyruvate tautomerase PptA (4-oxalocrotonate tautomerase family)